MSRPGWDDRIARAGELATSDLIRFYEKLLGEQKSLCLPGELSRAMIAARFPHVLDFFEREGSFELASGAGALKNQGAERWAALIEGVWAGRTDAEGEFFARAFLEPFAEAACAEPGEPPPDTTALCPCCGRPPVVSVMRQDHESARRSLVCSMCHWEWSFRRIMCVSCGEDRFDELPVFYIGEFPHLRVETCERCKTYLLCVDIGREPRAVPVVEDVAAVPLHLWAREHGYRRLQSNLLGL